MTATLLPSEKLSEEEIRIRRESREAWIRRHERMEAEFPRVREEHPDKWVVFGNDGFIAASDDLLALIDEYKEKGHHPDEVLIEFTHVSTFPLWGAPA